MDYEKKYKEALERARKELQACGTLDCDCARQMFRLFPELKESEDERIKKDLIGFFKDEEFLYHKKEEIVEWLEKQGASIDVDSILNKVGIQPAYKDGNAWCILYGDNLQDGTCGFGYTKEDALVAFIKELLEKQGGIDNCPLECSTNTVMTDSKKNQVEPKFKVGDWITIKE